MKAPLPPNEDERLEQLEQYQIVDTLPEQAYDDITYLASLICAAPIALVSLVASNRQWFKSKVGLEADETPRDVAFCAHAILDPGELTIVPDTKQDDRFADNPLVSDDPKIRFYAGAPLATKKGLAMGTLCVIDRVPRGLSEVQKKALKALSRQVMALLELRYAVDRLETYQDQLRHYQRKLEESNVQLKKESLTDALTGLRNRRAFDRAFNDEIARCLRYKTPLSVILLDIDYFKDYNDTYGHSRGDEVLRRVADLLGGERRRGDFLARYGGEEFAVILPGTGRQGAAILAERFRRAVEQASWRDSRITVSVGICSSETEAPADLLAVADEALYRAKRAGRNQVSE